MIQFPEPDLEKFALLLHEIGAVRLGQFRLHSGRVSPIYLDLRMLVSHPEVLRLATAVYMTILADLTYDRLAAAPMAGLPLGTALCLALDKPLIYPRKTAKSYGTGKGIEGAYQIGETAVIIDDLITSGDSVLQASAALKAGGLQVNDAVVLIDRQQGGMDALRNAGYQPHAAMTIRQILSILENHQRITARDTARVLQSL
ncbi:MAG: orotate phosphoribosyltransferase [Chloroflexi bacterium]|nr:MAG: orotate phosphoribosyltransferase [Chloroflexota bacterium]PIE81674.1 MAG: orotate phosphoribosyltransferase [Chloroflexota bacterium]